MVSLKFPLSTVYLNFNFLIDSTYKKTGYVSFGSMKINHTQSTDRKQEGFVSWLYYWSYIDIHVYDIFRGITGPQGYKCICK